VLGSPRLDLQDYVAALRRFVGNNFRVIMMAKNGRTVAPRPNGYANVKDGGKRATSINPTQRAAEQAARAALKREGGGELKILGEDGKIRAKDTVPPAKDPFPPKG